VRAGLRTSALTSAALVGFAANSLLCRGALRPGHADAATFTTVRLLSGAVVLAAIARGRPRALVAAGSWASAAALFVYAAAFSFAYLRIGAGVGALLAFGAVQTTMIGWALWTGERPRPAEWGGMGLATAGLLFLVSRGLGAPDPLGAALMLTAGAAWGVYSLRGRASARPLDTTAANFARAVLMTAILSLAARAVGVPVHLTGRGALLACLSGAIASGLGYTIWYAALRGLTATRAAVVQLSVPVLTAAGGVLILGETLTVRLAVAAAAILGGVALAVLGRRA
jgi:drug/metabolite transporter (DMT)-like permease